MEQPTVAIREYDEQTSGRSDCKQAKNDRMAEELAEILYSTADAKDLPIIIEFIENTPFMRLLHIWKTLENIKKSDANLKDILDATRVYVTQKRTSLPLL